MPRTLLSVHQAPGIDHTSEAATQNQSVYHCLLLTTPHLLHGKTRVPHAGACQAIFISSLCLTSSVGEPRSPPAAPLWPPNPCRLDHLYLPVWYPLSTGQEATWGQKPELSCSLCPIPGTASHPRVGTP